MSGSYVWLSADIRRIAEGGVILAPSWDFAAGVAWLAVRPTGTPYVWAGVERSSKPYLTTEGIRQVLKRLGKKAGVEGPVNPHSFRHGFAREYLLSGGDLAHAGASSPLLDDVPAEVR